MERFKHTWRKTPAHIRKPIVLVVGSLFILAAAATGWLPGPGGIPLFLVGIAILATEYTWAKRLEQFILRYIYAAGRWIRAHVVVTILIALLAGLALGYGVYYLLMR